MLVLIGLPTLVIYIAGLGLTMGYLTRVARDDVEEEMTRLARNYAAQFDAAFRETSAIATTTANLVTNDPDLAEEIIYRQLESNTLQNDAIFGAAMAFDPADDSPEPVLYCPYVFRSNGAIERMNIDRDAYDWYGEPEHQWWSRAKTANHGLWTDPYFDEGAGNVLMVTYSAPFHRDGAFRGVTTVDIMLPTFQEQIGKKILAEQEFAIVTSDGVFVSSARQEDIMTRSLFDRPRELGRDDVIREIELILAGGSGTVIFEAGATDNPALIGRQWVFYAPIESTNWTFLAIISEREALAHVRATVTLGAAALAGTLILILGSIWFVAGRITRPVERLRSTVLRIASGDLDAHVEGIDTTDEIGDLARSVNTMTDDLRSHIDRLAQEQTQRAQVESDLDTAREIQQGLLPGESPQLPGFEIAGWNQPADQTGGDYYDLLILPSGQILIAIADVTGHGVGPSLITAVFRAYLRAASDHPNPTLNEIMASVNRFLFIDTPSDRFVTTAVGMLDAKSNSMTLLSAGQAPLLFYEASTGEVHNWDADSFPMGIASPVEYGQPRTINFEPGDSLILATDGFFEWMNNDRKLFGTDRMIESVQRHAHLSPAGMIKAYYADVLEYGQGAAQGDDLTAVVIKRSSAS